MVVSTPPHLVVPLLRPGGQSALQATVSYCFTLGGSQFCKLLSATARPTPFGSPPSPPLGAQPSFLALFEKHADAKGKQAKLKSPVQLQELLDITRELLQQTDVRAVACVCVWGGGASCCNRQT